MAFSESTTAEVIYGRPSLPAFLKAGKGNTFLKSGPKKAFYVQVSLFLKKLQTLAKNKTRIQGAVFAASHSSIFCPKIAKIAVFWGFFAKRPRRSRRIQAYPMSFHLPKSLKFFRKKGNLHVERFFEPVFS